MNQLKVKVANSLKSLLARLRKQEEEKGRGREEVVVQETASEEGEQWQLPHSSRDFI